jgi:hypothetical protein
MAIPSQQIGWSQKSKLLWQISKQLEQLTGILYKGGTTTTTSSSTSSTSTTSTTTTAATYGYTLNVSPNGNPAAVCADSSEINATGNNVDFCSCTSFYSPYFQFAGQPVYVRLGTTLFQLDNQTYDGNATVIGSCFSC